MAVCLHACRGYFMETLKDLIWARVQLIEYILDFFV